MYCCRYIYETEQVLFLNCFYLVKHRYRLHLSFAHRELVFQKASNSYERHQLFSCFVIKLERKIVGNQRRTSHKMHSFIAHRKNNVSFLLERKIIENQLCTSNRNVKCVVLLPIVRKTSHFMSLVIYCVLLQVHLRNRTSFVS